MLVAPLVVIGRARHYAGTIDLLPVGPDHLTAEQRKATYCHDPSSSISIQGGFLPMIILIITTCIIHEDHSDAACEWYKAKYYDDPEKLEGSPDNALDARVIEAVGTRPVQAWKRITADFWVLALGNLNFGAQDVTDEGHDPCSAGAIGMQPLPYVEPNEGAMDLIIVRKTEGIGRWRYLKGFMEMDAPNPTHVQHDYVEVLKVEAVVLRPAHARKMGHLQCSGEELEMGDVLVKSHKGMLRMLAMDSDASNVPSMKDKKQQ